MNKIRKYYENIIENSYKRTEALKDYIKNALTMELNFLIIV